MVKVDSKGRIVLPQELRARLGIEPGTEVDVRAEDGKAIVDPEADPEDIIQRLEALVEEAAVDRDAPAEDPHPIAAQHAETVRRRANDNTDE